MIKLSPWDALNLLGRLRIKLKRADNMPDFAKALSAHTLAYEEFIKALWTTAKADPTSENLEAFIEAIVTASDDKWKAMYLDVLDIEDLLAHHKSQLDLELTAHKYYLQNSLLPDLLKELGKGSEAFNSFDYRVLFLYSGAMWSAGNVATVMFDGLDFRDLGDWFAFSGPKDSETCSGERGCDRYAGELLTVAQILKDDIMPGHMACLTNCRHILIPIASPLDKVATKGSSSSGNWGHIGRPGKVGGSAKGAGLQAIGATATMSTYQRRMRAQMHRDTRALLKNDLESVVLELGYDPNMVKYAGHGYGFEVGGRKFTAAADYNPNTGVIRVFQDSIYESDAGFAVRRGIMAHEIQHAKFTKFEEILKQQNNAITERLREEDNAGVPFNKQFLRPDGSFRNLEDAAKYPAVVIQTKLMDKHDIYKNLGGVSDYSNAYWEAYRAGKGGYYVAINETLAEVAKLRATKAGVVSKEWNDLYDELSKVVADGN